MGTFRYLILATTLSVAAPTSALGEPGVTVDPRSPAGQEYAVPVDAARQIGSGQGGAPATATPTGETVAPSGASARGSTPQLFGEGVEPPRQAGQPAQRRAGGRPAPRSVLETAAERTVSRAGGQRKPRAASQNADNSPSAASSESAVAPNVAARSMGTSALSVLLGGALLALVLQVVVRGFPTRKRVL